MKNAVERRAKKMIMRNIIVTMMTKGIKISKKKRKGERMRTRRRTRRRKRRTKRRRKRRRKRNLKERRRN
jgi:hypothetical protein